MTAATAHAPVRFEQTTVPDRIAALDAMLRLDHAQLLARYLEAPAPALTAVDGDLRGRMLAVPALPDWLTAGPRLWARSGSFPWRGKSFAALDAAHGTGVNRVASDRLRLFRFTTAIGPSRQDGAPALQLDYDHPGNPFFIRAIEDELRMLDDGVFLGQAWLRVGGRKHFVLWFGLCRA
ncbi:MAG: hypothetical protein K1X88_01250 [Nannocystaceae bacterium]|nr:hypothetical protein [Nannocystaceae bacterium]